MIMPMVISDIVLEKLITDARKQEVYTPHKMLLNSFNLSTRDSDVKRHSVKRYEEVTTDMIFSAFKAEVPVRLTELIFIKHGKSVLVPT